MRKPALPVRLLLVAALAAPTACSRRAAPVPPDPAGETPALHAGETPALHAGKTPALPAGETPALHAVAAPGPPKGLNVLLITIDSLRADMPWAGYRGAIAPDDRLREDGGHLQPLLLDLLVHGDEPRRPARGPLPGRARAQRPLLLQLPGQRPHVPRAAPEGRGADGERPGALLLRPARGLPPRLRRLRDRPGHRRGQPDRQQHHVPRAARRSRSGSSRTRPTSAGRFFAWFHFLDPHDEYMPHPGIGPYGKRRATSTTPR